MPEVQGESYGPVLIEQANVRKSSLDASSSSGHSLVLRRCEVVRKRHDVWF